MQTPPRFHTGLVIPSGMIAVILLVSGCSPNNKKTTEVKAPEVKTIEINGGFETVTAGRPSTWEIYGPKEGRPFLSKENPHGGTSFLRVPISGISSNMISGVQQYPPANLFKPGDIVTLSSNIRLQKPLEEVRMVKVAFEIFGPDEKITASMACNPKNTPGEWQTLSNTITIPAGFSQDSRVKVIASVFCRTAPKQENEVDFDDIVLSIAPAPKQKTP